VSEAAATGSALAEAPELPDDETLKPVTVAVRALLGVLGVLGTGERLTVLGRAGRAGCGRAGRIRTGDLRDPNAAR
jgi:hypothetical protein